MSYYEEEAGFNAGEPEKPEPAPVEEVKEPTYRPRLSAEISGDKPADTYRVSLPSLALKDFTEALVRFAEVIKTPTDAMNEWRSVAEEATEFYSQAGLYQSRLDDPKSQFEQGIQVSEQDLATISPLKFKDTSGEIKGELAILKVSKMLGLGDVVNVCLPHSGIWVTIKPPTERDLIDFYNTVFREKVSLGRSTSGLTFTNFSVHMNQKLFDFIVRHVHSVNYGDLSKEELKNHIVIHDFPILAWGFACAIYPNGFDFQRGCSNDLQECSYIAKETLNLAKLLWVDNSALTATQKQILSENRPNKLTLESYRKFKVEHSRVVPSTVTTKNDIKLRLKIPTFNEYTTDGLAWVNGVSATVENILTSGYQDDRTEQQQQKERLELLDQYVRASVLKQFNHFVEYIEVGDSVVTDRGTIDDLLEMFSSDDELRNDITEAVIKFKEATTLAVIGIPEYKCPSCGHQNDPGHKGELPRFVDVIALDTVNLFFLMLTSRISKILERDV